MVNALATDLAKKTMQARAQSRVREIATKQVAVLIEETEAAGGGYKFAGLQVDSKENEAVFRKGFESSMREAMKPFEGRENDDSLKDTIREAMDEAAVIYNRRSITSGLLVARNLRLLEVPKARVYQDGRVEAAGPKDLDIRRIAERMNELAAEYRV